MVLAHSQIVKSAGHKPISFDKNVRKLSGDGLPSNRNDVFNDHELYVPSQKICREKLREIQVLKQKQQTEPLNIKELIKIGRETYYNQMIKIENPKVLEILPDDIQQIIFEYVDPNTRLKMLRYKYNHKVIHSLLLQLPETLHTIYYLVDLVQQFSQILRRSLNPEGALYSKGYLCDIVCNTVMRERISEYLDSDFEFYKKFYTESFTERVNLAFKHYTKMYTVTSPLSADLLRQYEFIIIHMYAKLIMRKTMKETRSERCSHNLHSDKIA